MSDAAESDTRVPVTDQAPEPTPEAAPDQPFARRRAWPVATTIATAVLLAFGATMTVLYLDERGARDRAAASRARQLDDLQKQLAQAQTQRADLQARLRTAQDQALDPNGYEKIKDCVRLAAAREAALQKAFQDAVNNPGHPGTIYLPMPGQPGDSTCTDAAKYLK